MTTKTKPRTQHPNYGPNNGRWNHGIMVDSEGYEVVRVGVGHAEANPRGYARSHRLIMIAHLGRPLRKGEEVDHLNGDRRDNRIENLRLTTKSEHMRRHARETARRDAVGRFARGKKG